MYSVISEVKFPVDLFREGSIHCLQPDTFSVDDDAAKIQRPVPKNQLHQAPLTPSESRNREKSAQRLYIPTPTAIFSHSA